MRENSLVLYKSRPARVKNATSERIEIETASGGSRKVRPKDVVLIHPGPVADLGQLDDPEVVEELSIVWELLREETSTDLRELAEFVFGAFSPASSWAAWQLVADELYFTGTPDRLVPRPLADVETERQRRRARAQERDSWAAFLKRIREGGADFEPGDERYLRDVEDLARGRSQSSRVLAELGRGQSPENAHALLLELGRWDETVVPHPSRFALRLDQPCGQVAQLADEPRLDLTHLTAFAIDDEGSLDPDDALSVDGDRIWVHIADVAAIVPPASEADLEARARGANLYLPDGTISMLPASCTAQLGLGLGARSPALSFGLDIDSSGEVQKVELAMTWIAATRLTYAEAQDLLPSDPRLLELERLTDLSRQRRRMHGAVFLDWPEARIRVDTSSGEAHIEINQIEPLKSREIVSEAMILAGSGAAQYALERNLHLPFATQAPPAEQPGVEDTAVDGLAAMHALRRRQQRARVLGSSARHCGLGLDAYVRATSPLRRYLDLVAHQQLRGSLTGAGGLSEAEILERVGAADEVAASVRRAERLANRHWTLVYLRQRPGWRGCGVLIERRRTHAQLVIAELGLEVDVHLPPDIPVNTEVPLLLGSVDLPRLTAHFSMAS